MQGGLGLVFGVAVGADGVVYVLDTWRGADSNRVQDCSSADGGSTYALSGHITTTGLAAGKAFSMAVDGSGNVYLTHNDGYVLKYGPSGGTR